MKRTGIVLALVIAAVALLGALSTVAVAWACAAWMATDDVPGNLTSIRISNDLWDTTYHQKRFGHTRLNFMRTNGYYDELENKLVFEQGSGTPVQMRQETRSGWPLRALRCEREVVHILVPGRFGFMQGRDRQWKRGIELSPTTIYRALPYDVIWHGLAVDIALHSAAWWTILFGPFALRKHRRRKRGWCPNCAYDLRHNLQNGCPECGWARETAPQQPDAAT